MKKRILQTSARSFIRLIITLSSLISVSCPAIHAQKNPAQNGTAADFPVENVEEGSVHSTSVTFYQKFADLLEQQGLTIHSVLDVPNLDKHPSLMQDLADAFGVPKRIFHNAHTVGDYLCAILDTRYYGAASEQMDFFKIQYSSHFRDFENYMSDYPESANFREARNKYIITWLYMVQRFAEKDCDKIKYERCLADYQKFSDEYCRELYDESGYLSDCRLTYFNYEGYETIDLSAIAQKAQNSLAAIKQEETEAEKMWVEACDGNTYEGYRAYYQRYPKHFHSEEALDRLCEFEQSLWQQTARLNTRAAYDSFLGQYPAGCHATDATRHIFDLYQAENHAIPQSIVSMTMCDIGLKDSIWLGIVNTCPGRHTYKFTLYGETCCQKTLRPDEYFWIKLEPHNESLLLLESDNGESKLYTYIHRNGVYLLSLQDDEIKEMDICDFLDPSVRLSDKDPVERFAREAIEKHEALKRPFIGQ